MGEFLALPLAHQITLSILSIGIILFIKFLLVDYVLRGQAHIKFKILTAEEKRLLAELRAREEAERAKQETIESELEKRKQSDQKKQESLDKKKDRISKAKGQ
jgi:hypothetical protein